VDWREIPPEQSQVECAYCGTLIRVPGRSPQLKPSTPIVATGTPRPRTGGCSGMSGLVGLAILVVATVLFFAKTSWPALDTVIVSVVEQSFPGDNGEPGAASTRGPGASNPLPAIAQALAPQVRLVSRPYRLANNDQLGVQIVVFADQEEGTLLIGYDPVKRREGWRSPLLSDRTYEMGVASDAQRVYVADGAKLVALDRSDGRVIWQTSLANNLQTSCPDHAACLQVVGEQVVALARDGTVQAFLGATGAPLWSRRLNSTPRQLLQGGGRVVVIDNNSANDAVVSVIDPATGDTHYEVMPECDTGAFGSNAHSSDQFVVTPDESALLVLGSGTYACGWRYNLEDGSLAWSYAPDDMETVLPFTWAFGSFAFADPVAYFVDETNDPQIYALDTLAGGQPEAPLFVADQQYDLNLLLTDGELLLVAASPDYAREEVELWAIDRNTGERRWQRRLETSHTFDEWIVHPTETGFFVAVCGWNAEDCRFMVLDPQTGVSRAEVQAAYGWNLEGSTFWGDRAYLTLDGSLRVIDLTTAQVEYSWP
jgi:outer membrane protein assembly factor BamB